MNMDLINHVAWRELTVSQLWRPARIVPENFKAFSNSVRLHFICVAIWLKTSEETALVSALLVQVFFGCTKP